MRGFGPRWLALYALPPLAWAGLIFWLSSRTATQAGDALGPLARVPLVSEMFHFAEYFVLALLVFRLANHVRSSPGPEAGAPAVAALAVTRPVTVRALLTANVAGAIAFVYAISDELHQTLVPGRTFSVEDLAVDLAGIVTGVAAVWAWRSWRWRNI